MVEYLKRLSQRKMAQWALAYAAAAWVALQVVGMAGEGYGWPPLVMRVAFGIALIGFIATLILAWYHGERGEQKATGTELLILTALLVVGGGVIWQSERHQAPTKAVATAPGAAPAPAPKPEAEPAVSPRSIAVLPFANLSADKDNAYFADGIQDEILTRLSKIADLKVISRTSTMRYASKPDDLQEIARELGVANIVEGSVQKVGNKVRINVQLIEAATDTHLWAEIYDRELVDIFSIQSEVTTAIANALQATLTQQEQSAVLAKPTSNTPAYEAYLRGLAAQQQSGNPVTAAMAARPHFAEAVRLDPVFAEAWRRLIQVQSLLYSNRPEERTPAALAAMEQGVATVARLQPDSDNAWMALGLYRYRGLRDYAGASEAFERAIARAPNNSDAIAALAFVERRRGNMPDAMTHLSRALQLDPGNSSLLISMGEFLGAVRRFPEARAAYDRALVLLPDDPQLQASKISTYQSEGNLAAAQKLIDALPASVPDEVVMGVRLDQAWLQGRFDEAIGQCTAFIGRSQTESLFDKTRQIGCRLVIGNAQRLQGKAAASLAACKQALAIVDESGLADLAERPDLRYRANAHACLGDKAAAFRELRQAQDMLQGDTKSVPGFELTRARFHVRFGENDAAIAILKRSLAVPYGTTAARLRLDPDWTALRNDPRFQALLKQAP